MNIFLMSSETQEYKDRKGEYLKQLDEKVMECHNKKHSGRHYERSIENPILNIVRSATRSNSRYEDLRVTMVMLYDIWFSIHKVLFNFLLFCFEIPHPQILVLVSEILNSSILWNSSKV